MAANLSLQEVLALAEQLSEAEQRTLVTRLQEHIQRQRLSNDEWIALFDSMKVSIPPGENFSLRREDWYGDDGR